MAQTLAQIRAKTRTSIHGRQLGLADDFLGGIKDHRRVVTVVTTSGSVLPNHGFVTLDSTLDSYVGTLASPETGVGVYISLISSASTSKWVITSASTAATFISTAGTADTKLTFTGVGAQTHLMGVSTAVWVQMGGASTDASKVVAS